VNTQSTITLEPVCGYLVRVYPDQVETDTHAKYKAVMTIDVDGDTAVAKGYCGSNWNTRNRRDLFNELKNRGIKTLNYERYDSGRLIKSSVIKLSRNKNDT